MTKPAVKSAAGRCLHRAEAESVHRRIMTKHERSQGGGSLELISAGVWTRPASRLPPIIIHQPRYSISKLVWYIKTKGKAEKDGGQSCKQGEKCDVSGQVRNG